MDEDFKMFLEDEGFAPAIDCRPVDEATLNRYRGRLPDKLLEYWQSFGWCGYGEGRFWTVNPAEYEEILEHWLGQTPIWGRENFYVIARDAFGTLEVWGDRGEGTTTIMPHYSHIIPSSIPAEPKTQERRNLRLAIFFSSNTKESNDFHDHNEKPLFQRALKKLGPLSHDEMYAFVPALALGGLPKLKNLKRVKLQEQLEILAQLETPQLLKSVNELFGE